MTLKMQTCLAVLFCCFLVIVDALDMEPSQQSIDEGKQQYEMISQKAQIPNFGDCWTSALKELRRDCRHLDDVTQARLALLFASCFLETSGQQPISCEETDDVRPCLRRLTDRQFDSYREFFTHTQNMCSFLQVQVWHRQTSRVISRLGSEAAAVAERLERSGSVQEDILQAQERALGNQQQLMDQGRRMSKDVDSWRENLQLMVQDFREQTAEHRDLILTVFDRLTSLQQLVLDRFSWFNSLAHYVAGVLLVYLLTATARTAGARLWLFLVLTCNLGLERLLAAYFISAETPLQAHNAQQTSALLDSAVWLARRVAVSVCLIILAVTVYRYRDLNAANNRLLLELHRQHRELRAFLAAKGMSMGADATDGAGGDLSVLANGLNGAPWRPRRELSSGVDLGPRLASLLGRPDGLRRSSDLGRPDDLGRSGGDLEDLRARHEKAWDTVRADGDTTNRRDATASQRHELSSSAGGDDGGSDSASMSSELSLYRSTIAASPGPGADGGTRRRRPSLVDVLSDTLNGSLDLVSAAVRSPVVARVNRSRSNTPQPSPGRYNLRSRPGSEGRLTAAVRSPASLSRAAHRLEVLAERQESLVRRALHADD